MAIFSFKKKHFLSLLLLGTLNLASVTGSTSCTEESSCTEDPDSTFVFTLDYKRGVVKGVTTRRCKWLSQEINADKRAQLCQNDVEYAETGSASEMCPVTCGSCKLSLSSLDPLSFNPVDASICFSIHSANPVDASTFYSDLKLIVTDAYDDSIESTNFDYIIGESSFCSNDLLTFDGLMDISLEGTNIATGEEFVYKSSPIWAGENLATISLVDENGEHYTGAKVTAIFGDDSDVTSVIYSTDGSGIVTFENIPSRTILYQALDEDDGSFGVTAGYGETSLTITLEGFNEPSDIDNNDFSQGLDGWVVPAIQHVEIVDHVEDVGGLDTSSDSYGRRHLSKASADDVKKRMSSAKEKRENSSKVGESRQLRSAVTLVTKKEEILDGREVQANDDLATDKDVELSTAGILDAAETLARTFITNPGTTGVKIRYRFVTEEVPGGFWGTQYNDWYSVSIRSMNKAEVVSDHNNMNNIPYLEFDTNGSTPWRELGILGLDDYYGDTIEVKIEVANLVDCLYDSYVVVDLIEQF